MTILVPERIAPIPGAIAYGPELPEELLDSVEFYVPTYLGPAAHFAAMARMPRLQICQLLTAGFEHALDYLPPRVTLCRAVGVHDASTAEVAVGLILASLRRIDDAARAMEHGEWCHTTTTSLADRRVLIIGAGGVGRAIHERLTPFEVNMRMVARTARDGIASGDQLPQLLGQADIVVLAVPLDDTTRGMVDADFLARMRDDALLVNVSRGGIVDQEALLGELGRLHAALDVTTPEPLPADHPLWQAPNLLITPHQGGDSTAFEPRARELVTAQMRAWSAGELLQGIVSA